MIKKYNKIEEAERRENILDSFVIYDKYIVQPYYQELDLLGEPNLMYDIYDYVTNEYIGNINNLRAIF